MVVFIFDLVGTLITAPVRLFTGRMPKEIKKILIIRLDHVGDLLCTTPAFRAIKEKFPTAKLDVLVSKYNKDIVKDNPFIDGIMTYEAPWFKRRNRRIIKLVEFIRLAKALKGQKYDIGIDLRGDLRDIILMFLAAIKYKIGYGITGAGFLLDKEITYNPDVHIAEHNLDVLKAIGIETTNKRSEFFIADEYENFAKDFLIKNGLKADDFLVCVHLGAGFASKRWLPKKWAQLIDKLIKDFKARVIIIGTRDDKTLSNNIKQMVKGKIIDAVGETSLVGVAALLKKAKLFIGTDSGPSHIAASVDTPSVILYSGTNYAKHWAPLGKKIIIIQKDIPCKGCERLKCANNICMDLINVDEVIEAIRKVLDIC